MRRFATGLFLIAFVVESLPTTAAASTQASSAQDDVSPSIEVVPGSLTLKAGETAQLKAVVKDAEGNVMRDAQVVFFSMDRISLGVTVSGLVDAHRPGEHKVTAILPDKPYEGAWDSYSERDPGVRATITVTVPVPPLASLRFVNVPSTLYSGTTAPVAVTGTDVSRAKRDDFRPTFSISNPTVAQTDGFGHVTALRPGKVILTATAEGVKTELQLMVKENPVRSLDLTASRNEARTGDVIHFKAVAKNASGQSIDDVPISYVLQVRPDRNRAESLGAGAPAHMEQDGRFVAEQPGIYTVVAICGSHTARYSVLITSRDVAQRVEFVGHAPVRDRVTSDLWVWEGVDGRDYAVVGTWNAEGHAYFYDVTDPTNMELIDTVQVDARTVNDVKVSEDGRICVISREGASNRRNGFVILDVSNPRDVKILSHFDDQLTGGVHNLFIYRNHVYAINNGRRWDVINIEDPTRPRRVGRFETTTPGRAVHDVWVRDGIAYQAGRTDGLIVIDVGGGGKGGSPSRPVEMGRFPQLTLWNHAVWPFRSKSAGKFYVVGGDEAFYIHPLAPEAGGILWKEKIPSRAKGWLHFVEFDDMENPREIARYQIPDSGPHNLWIDWDKEIMYVAHFDSGLRVVDISGELMGDLYRQGREIAKFYSDDNQGFVPNAPFVWGPQPHKGAIFFSDLNSGLWAVRLIPREQQEKTSP